MISDRDLWWAAGFLEGEGSFQCHGSIVISANQVQKEPLECLKKIFGGVIGQQKEARGKQQHCNVWRLNGYRSAGVMMTLFSLMSPRRKEQIAVALTEWKNLKISNRLKTACPNGHQLQSLPSKTGKSTYRFCPICKDKQTRQSAIRRGKRKGTYRHRNQREMF